MEPEFNEDKFKELILYIAQECKDHPFFGATKLNKLLFYSDFIAYAQLGHSITGAEYMALEWGPVPKRLVPVREEMLFDDEIIIEERGLQKRVVPQRAPDQEQFAPEERKIVNNVVELLRYRDAETITELSHGFLGWRAAWAETLATGHRVLIPYSTVHASNEPPSNDDLRAVKELAKQNGWSFQ